MATCDRDQTSGAYLSSGCYKGTRSKRVTIKYTSKDRDSLLLCETCAEFVARDAKKYGYNVEVTWLK